MNDIGQISALKNKQKITNKGYGNTIDEIRFGKQEDQKKYRKKSTHNFHNKSGFYMN